MKIFAPLNSEPEPLLQEVEVATFLQLPSFQIIGLPSPEVAEAKERIRSAIEASGKDFPRRRVILNLSPAHVRKRGTGLDLPMALAILGLGQEMDDFRIGAWGELGLEGIVKPAGQITRAVYAAWKGKLSVFMISHLEYSHAIQAIQWIQKSNELDYPPPRLVPVERLEEAWRKMEDLDKAGAETPLMDGSLLTLEASPQEPPPLMPLSKSMERMIGVAVSGHHHMLLLGPRGTGKTHALEWFIGLQPPVSAKDRLRQILIAELGSKQCLWNEEIVRKVSSQVRPGALIGGVTASTIRPGEFSLAHGGVLVADELPEWNRDSREMLREPLERGRVSLTRAQGSLDLPAKFLFAANGNLCPCGGWPPHIPKPADESLEGRLQYSKCKCSDTVRRSYLNRLSGPILDRVDITLLFTQSPLHSRGSLADANERFQFLKAKIEKTQNQLKQSWGGLPGSLSGEELERILRDNKQIEDFISKLPVSSLRSRHKIIRIALTLSAWDKSSEPGEESFLEALTYRAERFLFVD